MIQSAIRGDKYTRLLHIGQLVHCGLYGGQDGYISKIDGKQTPGTIRSLCGGAMVMGGSANITVHFDRGHDSNVPESIIRGVQWTIGPEPINDEVIADCLIRSIEIDMEHNASVKRKAAEAEAIAKERAQQLEQLPNKYSYLETVKAYEQRTGKKYGARTCAAQNIRKELARTFPGVKFSVTSKTFAGGDSIDIDWTDGPADKEVERITSKYNDHANDETGDYRDPTNCVFNTLYGGAKYVMTQRSMSKETEQALSPWANHLYEIGDCFAKDSCSQENLIWRLVANYSIPAGAHVTGAERTDVTCGGGVADWYKLTY